MPRSNGCSPWPVAGKPKKRAPRRRTCSRLRRPRTAGAGLRRSIRLQSAFALAIAADNLDRDHPVEMWSPERLAERKKLIDRSFEALDLAITSGFDDHYQLETDPDIDALRGDPRFVAILEKLRTQSKAK